MLTTLCSYLSILNKEYSSVYELLLTRWTRAVVSTDLFTEVLYSMLLSVTLN